MFTTINDDVSWAGTQWADSPIRVPDNDGAWVVWQLRLPSSHWPQAPMDVVAQMLYFDYLDASFQIDPETGAYIGATDHDYHAADTRAYETIAKGLAEGSIVSQGHNDLLDVPHAVKVNLDAVHCWMLLLGSKINPKMAKPNVPDSVLEQMLSDGSIPEPLRRLVNDLARDTEVSETVRGFGRLDQAQAFRAILGNPDAHRWAARLLRLLAEIDSSRIAEPF